MQLVTIQSKIYIIRDHNVMLDYDLAEMYETDTKRLKEAVRRNISRFPEDFMFELTKEEFKNLRTQIATSKHGGTRYAPFAFTEQGVAMLSSVLNSQKAIDVNIQIIRAFVALREFALSHKELTAKIQEIEAKYDKQFQDVYQALNFLLERDTEEKTEKRKIGFDADS